MKALSEFQRTAIAQLVKSLMRRLGTSLSS